MLKAIDMQSASEMPVKVQEIKQMRFSSLSLEEKLEVKNRGRPTPEIKIECEAQANGKKYKRSFNCDIYKQYSWLCGCETTNRLYCFPCILLGGGRGKLANEGFSNLNNIKKVVKEHAMSENHINNAASLNILGKSNILSALDEGQKVSIERHNKKVKENLEVLDAIVKTILFCGHFELALRGHNETSTSQNRGIFRELIDFEAEKNPILKEHLINNKVFKGTSAEIQNDILDCVVEVYV